MKPHSNTGAMTGHVSSRMGKSRILKSLVMSAAGTWIVAAMTAASLAQDTSPYPFSPGMGPPPKVYDSSYPPDNVHVVVPESRANQATGGGIEPTNYPQQGNRSGIAPAGRIPGYVYGNASGTAGPVNSGPVTAYQPPANTPPPSAFGLPNYSGSPSVSGPPSASGPPSTPGPPSAYGTQGVYGPQGNFGPPPQSNFGPPPVGSQVIPTPGNQVPPPIGSPLIPGGSLVDPATIEDPLAGAMPLTPIIREGDLVVGLTPGRTGRIQLGGAVNSDAGVNGQFSIDERNFDITRWPRSFQDLFSGNAFRGAGQTFRLEAAPGSRFKRYTVSFANPNLLGYLPYTLSVSGFLFDRRFDDWDEERLGARVALGYRVTPDLSLSVGVRGENVDLSNPTTLSVAELAESVGDNEMYSAEFRVIHDTRNRSIVPSSGHFFEFSFEEVFGKYDYARFETEFRQYWLLTERADRSGAQTLSYSLRLGFSGDDTPIFENFFAGGYATMRGFDFRGASPTEVGVEVGGQLQFLNTIEYMFPITADDSFRGVAFCDFGTVEREFEINSDNFRVAPGLGLRVNIPMLGPAPLAFDFAYPIAEAAGDRRQIFSFYMSVNR